MDEIGRSVPLRATPAIGWTALDCPSLAGVTCDLGESAGDGDTLVSHIQSTDESTNSPGDSQSHVIRTVIAAAAHLHDELRAGPGFAVWRSFGGNVSTVASLERLYLELGDAVGCVAPQNSAGHLLRHVKDEGSDPARADERRAYGHRGRAAMNLHSDSADYVGLLCVHPAMSGGSSTICNSKALHDRVRSQRPDLLEPLYRGFHFDVSAMAPGGNGATALRVPVFSGGAGSFSCIFNRERILVGMKRAGASMTALEMEAVDYLHGLAASDEFLIRVALKAQDLLFLNNHRTLHGRDAFEDGPDGRRLVLRIWINLRERGALRQIPTA